MEIILKETIDTLGREGEIVKVKNGYARNYLIPQKKAVLVNEDNLAELEQEKQAIAERLAIQQKDAEAMISLLADKTVIIKKKVGEENRLFGSVTNNDIAAELAEINVPIDKKNIILKEPIKEAGEYKVTIKVGYQITTDLNVQVIPDTPGE